jgi:hypothetical protein
MPSLHQLSGNKLMGWNGENLVFILDHIDGNWRRHIKNNLRLICPNCNSQLDTTKNHWGKGRRSNRQFYKNYQERLKKAKEFESSD